MQLSRKQRKKTCDSSGVMNELLKASGAEMRKIIADVFTDVMEIGLEVPAYWKDGRLKVLITKVEAHNPDNYRPISILPILYKLISRILCGRIKGTLLESQSVDQACFRPSYNCEDHLFAITLLAEKLNEYSRPL